MCFLRASKKLFLLLREKGLSTSTKAERGQFFSCSCSCNTSIRMKEEVLYKLSEIITFLVCIKETIFYCEFNVTDLCKIKWIIVMNSLKIVILILNMKILHAHNFRRLSSNKSKRLSEWSDIPGYECSVHECFS